jgi:PAS domain-containing protein
MSTTTPSVLPTAVEELERSRTHLALALEVGHMGSWDCDLATGRVRWSPEQERLYGLAPGAFDGTVAAFRACVHPDDRATAWQPVDDAWPAGRRSSTCGTASCAPTARCAGWRRAGASSTTRPGRGGGSPA